MSLSGARGLGRMATNLDCDILSAMVADHYREDTLYRDLTGRRYPREYGERISARRRGAKFEANLYQNNAALLRKATGALFGYDPDSMWVRNFLEELPGSRLDRLAFRSSRFRQILRDLRDGKHVPDLIIQPAMVLAIGSGPRDFTFVSPDCVVLDRSAGIYVPAELKSFIERDVGPNPQDLAPTRLQAAAQVIALRGEAARLGLAAQVAARAVLIFATPYGLAPTPGREERLQAEVYQIGRAITKLRRAKEELARQRAVDQASLPDLVPELRSNYQESCIASCALADICRQGHAGRAAELGDAAVEMFGPDADLDRLADLAIGAEPRTPWESEIANALRDAAQAIEGDDHGVIRRSA